MPARGKKGEPVEHNLDPTVKEMVLDIFASLLDFVPSTDDKTCYHMRSLLDYICEKHDLNIGLDSLREKAACRYRNKLNPITTEQSTQTDSQTPVAVAAPAPPTNYRDVATSTQLPPTRTYAEAASSNTPHSNRRSQRTLKGKGKAPNPPQVHSDRAAITGSTSGTKTTPGSTPAKKQQTSLSPKPQQTKAVPPEKSHRTIVLHGAPTKHKPGTMRQWIIEDNKNIAILGIHWLLQEGRRVGKQASSLVIYLEHGIDITRGVRMGRRIFRTTRYDWER